MGSRATRFTFVANNKALSGTYVFNVSTQITLLSLGTNSTHTYESL